MISSKVIETLTPLFEIIKNAKGKTISQIKDQLFINDKCKMKKGASGLIVENLLGIENNNRDEADIPQIGCEVKILPLQINKNGAEYINGNRTTVVRKHLNYEKRPDDFEKYDEAKNIHFDPTNTILANNIQDAIDQVAAMFKRGE